MAYIFTIILNSNWCQISVRFFCVLPGTRNLQCKANSPLIHWFLKIGDGAIGTILLILSLICLCGSLMIMVKILNTLLQGSVAVGIKVVIDIRFGSCNIETLLKPIIFVDQKM